MTNANFGELFFWIRGTYYTTKCIRLKNLLLVHLWHQKALINESKLNQCLSGLFDISDWLSHFVCILVDVSHHMQISRTIRRYVLHMIVQQQPNKISAQKWPDWYFILIPRALTLLNALLLSDIYRMCLWRINTRAWWIDLANPSLKTWVWRRRSKKSSIFKPNT